MNSEDKEVLEEENILDNRDNQEEEEYGDEQEGETQSDSQDQARAELQLEKDKYMRLYSEFDNFRRRTSKEKLDLIANAGQKVIHELLPVFDDFDRAVKAIEASEEQGTAVEGVMLVYNKLKNTLKSLGVAEVDAQGKEFDDELHEAITTMSAGDELKGKVVDVVEKGYTMNDKLIRHAKVVVGS